MTWKTFALVAMTYDQTKEDLSSLSCGPFNLGPGSEKYPEAASVIVGENAARFLARFDALALWHWAPPWVLRAIRSHAQKPIKIGFVCAYEAVPTVGFWSLIQAPLFAVSEAFALKGTDGKPVTNGPVTWIDVAAPGYAEAHSSCVEWLLDTKFKSDRPDFFLFDNCLGRPFYGTAPNAPTITASWVHSYTEGWSRLIREHQGRISPLAGNTNIWDPTYRELTNTFLEHAVSGNAQVDWLGIAAASQNGRTVIGWEGQPPTQDYWTALEKALTTARNDHVYICTARTGKNFALIGPPQ